MPDRSDLGTRMKGYESVSKTTLVRRMPVIIRIDGKAFHTFTRGMQKPFDGLLVKTMQDTMLYLCKNIQGCVLGYTQSDEITLVLVDYQSIDTCAWFDNKVQKMCSISASMATLAFNKAFEQHIFNIRDSACHRGMDDDLNFICEEYSFKREFIWTDKFYDLLDKYQDKQYSAMFDSRVFNLPKEEVTNCLIWRQQDAVRNSIQSVGQANFSHKELHQKNCNMIQDMLMTEKGINWNDTPTHLKRGSCCIKKYDGLWSSWVIDTEIPIFTQDRDYIENLINI